MIAKRIFAIFCAAVLNREAVSLGRPKVFIHVFTNRTTGITLIDETVYSAIPRSFVINRLYISVFR